MIAPKGGIAARCNAALFARIGLKCAIMFGLRKASPLSGAVLREVLARLPVFAGLRGEDDFVGVAHEFARTKDFSGADGMVVTEEVVAVVSALSALPIWRLGMDWVDDWRGVVLYPDSFLAPTREERPVGEGADGGDFFGGGMTVVHEGVEERAGEAMAGGGIVLSWRDVLESGWGDGFNVVAHETAHKLDMRNGGEANGFPPLHQGMSRLRWTETMEFGFADLGRRIERDEDAPVDDGAAEDAGEFFAFCAESFFETPNILRKMWPGVYAELRTFYRQDPAARLWE